MLRGWVHSGFNVYRSRRVAPEERADLERLAQYIIRNPFSVEKMQVAEANRSNPDGSIIYHSGMNPKIQRNFEVFTPCEFIAAITQHIPDKSFQLVRYYGWYSNKIALIDDKAVIERILRHLGLWQQGVRIIPGPDSPGDWVIEPCPDDTVSDHVTDLDLVCANA
jgi:hypothetical protein